MEEQFQFNDFDELYDWYINGLAEKQMQKGELEEEEWEE